MRLESHEDEGNGGEGLGDFYDDLEFALDNDEISASEEGFMMGYELE
jgi:hypothetical protein